jgi:hypothetical protein
MKHRAEYSRLRWSTVWHFVMECRWYPAYFADMGSFNHNAIRRKTRPTTGTLCDHCQRLEKKAKRGK